MKRSAIPWLTLVIGLSSTVLAAVPPSLRVQGDLRTSAGTPVTGAFDLGTRLYDAATGGQLLHAETHNGVAVSGGVFDVVLAVPGNIAEAQALWLEVQVGAEAPLPRQRLLSTAYSLAALKAETAAVSLDLQCSGCVGGGDVGSGAISGVHLAASAVGPSHVSFNYATSTSKGGAALALQCTGCIDSGHVAFGYAASASAGGPASDLECTGCVASPEVTFTWAAGKTKGGAAADLDCTGCVGGADLATGAVETGHVGFNYAASTSKGGPATGLSCTGCVQSAHLASGLALAGNVTVAGGLTACTGNAAGCGVAVSDAGRLADTNDGWLQAQVPTGLKVRSSDGSAWRPLQTGDLSVQGATTLDGAVAVQSSVQIGKAGTTSTIAFAAQTNDPGFIRHIENNNAAELRLAASDDFGVNSANDVITFGGESGGVFAEKVRIRGDGRVGVGTTSPSSLLHVNGVVTALGLSVPNSAIPASAIQQGSGSGLDADTLDGLDASAIVAGMATAAKQDEILAKLNTLLGRVGEYSRTCTDWSARGWANFNACMQDGRWHEAHRIQGPWTTADLVTGVATMCSNTPGIPGHYVLAFDDIVNTHVETRPGAECGDTFWYDSTGTLRLRISNGSAGVNSLPASNNANNNATYMVRY
ncbi:MAG: hypothetical protein AMXMBFR64_05610 [Myxococcales bacterium]